MADRDYRVTYRSRPLDSDNIPIRRIPTALDPYEYPEDRAELMRAVAESKARTARYRDDYSEYEAPVRRRDNFRDDISVATSKGPARPGTTKTTYSVTDAGLEKESEVNAKPPTRAPFQDLPPTGSSRLAQYRERDDFERSSIRNASRPYVDREFDSTERVYDYERPRREGGAYVVDVRDADAVDIYPAATARESNRGFGGYRNDPYDDQPPRSSYIRPPPTQDLGYRESRVVYTEREDARTSAPSLQDDGAYMSGARQDRAPVVIAARGQSDVRGPTRASTRVFEDDRRSTKAATYGSSRQPARREEDDFAFVERTTTRGRAPSVRESFNDPFESRGEPQTPRGRTEVGAYTSPPEDEYVMVSPPRQATSMVSGRQSAATGTSLRSAMLRNDSYTPDERQRRRRSRSINFRDGDIDGHDCGDRFHEQPGAEAAMMGRYLKKYSDDGEKTEDRQSSRQTGRYDEYYHNKEVYEPQKVRNRSRGGGRRRQEADDERDYTDTYREKTTKTTYY